MNIYGYLILAALVVALIAVVSTYIYLERKKDATLNDVATIFFPFLLWFGLTLSGILPKSLANLFLEPLVLFPIVVLCLLVRAFSLPSWSNAKRSRSALISVLLVAVAIYIFMPLLPE